VRFEIDPDGGDGGRAGGSGRARLVTVGALAALASALVIAGAALSAGSSASASTITACVKKSTGAARIVSSSTRCKRGERRVTWKRIGPAGKQGPPGAQGATGAEGAQGTPGADGAPGPPGIEAFNDLEGLPCTRPGDQHGTIDVVFGPGSVARTRCVVGGDSAVCGDGFTEGTEACDDGNTDTGDNCTNQCRFPACGDGITSLNEQCDPGSSSSSICDGPTGGVANACTIPVCGDGFRNQQAGEQCDDGNSNNADGCNVRCQAPSCGNGITDQNEQCDDGNANDGDKCSNACTAQNSP
jgi:cysteine-rich repeat protein